MTTHQKILYASVKNFELERRLERDDYAFDAFEFLSGKVGHKNSTTLRKMCEVRSESNVAKLGFEEAIILMAEMKDYRLLRFMIEQLRAVHDLASTQQNLFSRPITSLDETKL